MVKPLLFPFLGHNQKVGMFSNGYLDLSVNIIFSYVVFVRDVQHSSVAAHLKDLHSFL